MKNRNYRKGNQVTKQFFEHYIAYITARIENKLYDQIHTGTGFFYLTEVPMDDGKDRMKLLLISNKHVFLNSQGRFDPTGRLTIRLNRKKADGTPDYGNVITFDQFNNLFAHPDPEVDLACLDVSHITHTDAFWKHLDRKHLKPINYEKVAVGKEVIFVGYPADYYDNKNNLPLIRKGAIASMPNIDFNGRGQIVLDAQIFPGSSGSPVFVDWDNKYSLLGVVSDMVHRNSKLQILPVNMPQLGVTEALGLGIIIKHQHVQELIDHVVNEIIRINSNSIN